MVINITTYVRLIQFQSSTRTSIYHHDMVSRRGLVEGMSLTVTASSSLALDRTLPRLSRDIHNSTASFSVGDAATIIYNDSPAARIISTVVSLVCMSLLAGMLGKRPQTREMTCSDPLTGYRAKQYERFQLRALHLTRVLVLFLNFMAISFVTSATVVESGLGLYTSSACHSAIAICLAFYVGSKVTM